MLRLLLDEHLSPRIVNQFLVRCPGANIASVLEWQDARLASTPDELLLTEAHQHQLTLVTYDQATIVPLLKSWAEAGISHSGVIFIDDKTIRQDDFGGIVRALAQIWENRRHENWINRVVYLTRPGAK
jgi:hypothetical protein